MRRELLKYSMVPFGIILGIINSLPLPWRLRLIWGNFICWIMESPLKRASYFIDYLQKETIDDKSGKPGDYRNIQSIYDFENSIKYLEVNSIPLEKIANAVKRVEEENVELTDYRKHLSLELLREKNQEEV